MSKQTGDVYALGVTMGITSFQANVATANTTGPTIDGLVSCIAAAKEVSKGGIPLNVAALQKLIDDWFVDDDRNFVKNELYPRLVTLRGEYQGDCEVSSFSAGHSYILGVSIGIAEGQATSGNGARSVVHDSIGHAVEAANKLALSTKELDAIRDALVHGADVKHDVYAQVTNLRGLLQKRVAAIKLGMIRKPAKK